MNESCDPNSKITWSHEEILHLINFVKKNRCLYDKSQPDYKNHNVREKIWHRVGLRHSAGNCKRKWNTLRIQLRRLVTKRLPKGKRKRKSYNDIQWPLYDPLQFIVPHMEWCIKSELDGTDTGNDEEVEDNDAESEAEDQKNSVQTPSHQQVIHVHYDNQYHEINETDEKVLLNSLNQSDEMKSDTDGKATIPLAVTTAATMEQSCAETTAILPQLSVPATVQTIAPSSATFYRDDDQHPPLSSLVATKNSDFLSPNYFLMDVKLQMEKLNDFAQMELKIEIQKLLLAKLKDPNNLRYKV